MEAEVRKSSAEREDGVGAGELIVGNNSGHNELARECLASSLPAENPLPLAAYSPGGFP
jgi:hypothetical protein